MVDRQGVCPQSICLEDGRWINAPWMEWKPAPQTHWYCSMCWSKVDANHLTSHRHTKRIHNWWDSWAYEVGQPIVDVRTHNAYTNRPWPTPAAPQQPAQQPAQQTAQQPQLVDQQADPQTAQQPQLVDQQADPQTVQQPQLVDQPQRPPPPPPPPPPPAANATHAQHDEILIELLRRIVEQNAVLIEMLEGTRGDTIGLLRRIVEQNTVSTELLNVVANNAAVRGTMRASRDAPVRGNAAPAASTPRATSPPPGLG